MTEDCDKKPPLKTDFDLTKPRYDHDRYFGRVHNFFNLRCPINAFASTSAIQNAKAVVQKYEARKKVCLTENELWKAKYLHDSSYHPKSKEVISLPGRPSFYVPGNMLIIGGMMAYYRSAPAVIFWQWLNQSFNFLVEYTGRNGGRIFEENDEKRKDSSGGDKSLEKKSGEKKSGEKSGEKNSGEKKSGEKKSKENKSKENKSQENKSKDNKPRENKSREASSGDKVRDELLVPYTVGTISAVGTAFFLNHVLRCKSPLLGRLVPFFAVSTAHCFTTPLLRQKQMDEGVPVYDVNEKKIAISKNAANEGTLLTIFNKALMATPPMVMVPVCMHYLDLRGTICRYPWSVLPNTILLTGLFLWFGTPLVYGLFREKGSMPFDRLEGEVRGQLGKGAPKVLYYEKGF